jgi:hypothetical protein
MVEVVGTPADGLNAAIYKFEGKDFEAKMSVAAMLPGGIAATTAKYAKGLKLGDKLVDGAKILTKNADEVAEGAVKAEKALDGIEGTGKVVNGFDTTVHAGKQGKHILGHNNYTAGRSILNGTEDGAQKLVDEFAGTGQWKTANKEMVDFGKNIGKYVDINTGEILDTTRGIIHYSKKGVHIVPAKPIP